MVEEKDGNELLEMTENSLLENVRSRKRRLQELKMQLEDGGGGEKLKSDEPSSPIVFRGYEPTDSSLGSTRADVDLFIVEKQIDEQLEHAKNTKIKEHVDITALAPKKVDWDLKRDIAEKMKKLERRTQKAIAQLIRNRLAAGEEGLVAAVNSSVAYNDSQFDD